MIASSRCLEENFRNAVRSKSKGWERKKKARRRKCKVKFSLIWKNKGFQKSYMKIGVRKLLRLVLVSARAWRGNAVGNAPTLWLNLRRQMAAAVHKIRYVFGIAALQS